MELAIILLSVAVIAIVFLFILMDCIEKKKIERRHAFLYFVPNDFFEDHEYDCEFELVGHLNVGDLLAIYSPIQEITCEVMAAKYDEESDSTVVCVATLMEREV